MKMQVSTADVEHTQRVAFWTDLVCAHLVEVECQGVADASGFSGSVTKVALPRVAVAHVRAGAQVVQRTEALLRRTRDDIVLINIQRRGESRLRQAGRDAVLPPGELAFYSSERRYELSFDEEVDQTVLMFPRHCLPGLADDLDKVRAVGLRGSDPNVRLLTHLAHAALDTADGLDGDIAQMLEQTLLQTILATATSTAGRPCTMARLARFHLARVREFALSRLHDPSLDVATIAAGVGLSRSQLHRLMAREPQSLMEWVWECRLMACRRALEARSGARETVSEIAFRHGFMDMSHFSRAYRRRFGMAPRETPVKSANGS